MHLWFAASWLSTLVPSTAPAPQWPEPPGRERPARPELIDRPGSNDFRGSVRRVGKIPWRVKEYGHPALEVRADNVTVRRFAWRGSMEGVNVGSESFDGRGMRRRHRPIRVLLDGLWCDDIGEDGVSIQPRARVTIRNSFFRGNHRLLRTDNQSVRGLDKIVQIDGADVLLENCEFHHAVSAVRGKANSHITLKNCRFVRCSTCVSGDGLANPRPGDTYDNGQPGHCRIILVDCEAWDCGLLARAYAGCHIDLINCRVHGTRLRSEHGGRVETARHLPPRRRG